jgi:tRNA nucleotidyltransferase/poly(A) polymerase
MDGTTSSGGEKMATRSWFERKGVIASIRRLLAERSWEGYLVGGYVRDLLLGRDTRDLDLAVSGDALVVAREMADRLGGAFVVLDAERHTGRVVLHEGGERFYVDFAALRGGDPRADLGARDFTINALAIDVHDVRSDPEVVDLFGGRRDLESGVVRAVSDSIFRDDAIRLLRGLRLAAELEMEIDEATEALVLRDAGSIAQASAERVRDELCKILSVPRAEDHLRYLDRLGLLGLLLPELEGLRGLEQPPPHHQDAWEHSLATVGGADEVSRVIEGLARGEAVSSAEGRVAVQVQDSLQAALGRFSPQLSGHLKEHLVDERSRSALLKLAALLHDVGKASTGKIDEENRIRFFGHAREGSILAARALRRLRFGVREVRSARSVIRHHMRPLHLAKAGAISRRAIHRFFRDTDGAGLDVLLLSLADNLALVHEGANEEQWERICEVVGVLLAAYYEQHADVVEPPPLLRGADLLEHLGMEPGPAVGRVLRALSEAQATGQVSTREQALSLAESLLSKEGD